MSKPSPNAPRPDTQTAPKPEPQIEAPGTAPIDVAQLERELARVQRELAEERQRSRDIEESAHRRIDELTEERDAARAAADRAEAALHAHTRGARATPRTPDGAEPVRLRALSGIAFTIGGARHRLRAGETIDARPADLEDDGLALGTHFEIVRA